MSALLWFATALTRAWTAAYTKGLPAELRAERRDEVDCDLWEHERLADLQREPVTGTAIEVLLRLILGVPSDLTWRIEARASTNRRTTLNDTPIMRIGLLLLMLPPFFIAANGIIMLLGGGDFETREEQVLYGAVISVSALVAMGGLWLCASQPRLGVGMVVAGVIPTCALLYWMLVITVPIGLVTIAFAVKRAGFSILPFRGPRPSATGGP